MKKIYVLTTALFIGANIQAQSIFDFENVTLSPESYDNGSGGLANFTDGSITLFNDYNTSGGYWSGFSISNTTDVTTAGYGNQYSSFTGSGRNSDNYAVFYYEGNITTTNNQIRIDGFYISNSTYAAISMRDGDGPGGFAKQFGSVNGADGNPDGTNGEDFFKVWVIGHDYNETVKDSVEFYLADYRFPNNNDDYIVDDWNYIDLSNFSFNTSKVTFRFESSDVSFGYVNTPTYFVLDDIQYSSTAEIKENTLSNVTIYPNPVNNVINIKGEKGELNVLDINGRTIHSSYHSELSVIDLSEINSGIYFVKVENEKGSFTEKVVKQ